jgi:cell division protein FtsX
VVVITQSLADRVWPGEHPVGRRLRFSAFADSLREHTVVGVAGNVASSRATEDWPHIFVALQQNFQPRIMVAVRGTTDAAELIRPIQAAVIEADPNLPLPSVSTSESLVTRSTEGQRITAQMAALFGALALLLSAIGVYGVIAFTVANRTREIGVRMALGATRASVLRTVLGDAVRLAAPGLVIGGLLAVAAGYAMRSTLLGVSPVDPVSFGSVIGVLVFVVLLASVVPARKASGTDPMEALRCE